MRVSGTKVKEEILSIAPSHSNNIILIGEDENLQMENILNVDKKDDDDEIRFEQIINLYRNNAVEGKKIISKLLSKEKEKLIYYLLKEEVDNN